MPSTPQCSISSDAGPKGQEDLTLPAQRHFLLPGPLNLAVAYGPVDEPAQMPQTVFPRRALLPGLFGAALCRPAVLPAFAGQGKVMGKKKEGLPFHMDRDSSPPLFKALDRLKGGPKELGQFLLCLPQMSSDAGKFAVTHVIDSC